MCLFSTVNKSRKFGKREVTAATGAEATRKLFGKLQLEKRSVAGANTTLRHLSRHNVLPTTPTETTPSPKIPPHLPRQPVAL